MLTKLHSTAKKKPVESSAEDKIERKNAAEKSKGQEGEREDFYVFCIFVRDLVVSAAGSRFIFNS